jgi:SAM-dependent methyltransferase
MTNTCPICHSVGTHLHTLEFSQSDNLPKKIDLTVCVDCDFAFTEPRDKTSYTAYYNSTVNDSFGIVADLTQEAIKRYSDQLNVLKYLLDRPQPMRILDVGCGQAGLLSAMSKRYPRNSYFAVDPNISVIKKVDSQLHFSADWRQLDGTFDLIILSHVIEHMVDFDEIKQLTCRLSETGNLYIEVPDAPRYRDFQRREFLYYFDRLHVNHFTGYALQRLLKQWGLNLFRIGENDFDYKDGSPYPALFIVASPCKLKKQNKVTIKKSLLTLFKEYIANELTRFKPLRRKLEISQQIVVYGFGDNFFRSISNGGPLAGLQVSAVIDRRYLELKESEYANSYQFMDIDACCRKYPKATYVINVSWGSLDIEKNLIERDIKNIITI